MKWTNSYRSFGLKTKRSTGLKTIEHKHRMTGCGRGWRRSWAAAGRRRPSAAGCASCSPATMPCACARRPSSDGSIPASRAANAGPDACRAATGGGASMRAVRGRRGSLSPEGSPSPSVRRRRTTAAGSAIGRPTASSAWDATCTPRSKGGPASSWPVLSPTRPPSGASGRGWRCSSRCRPAAQASASRTTTAPGSPATRGCATSRAWPRASPTPIPAGSGAATRTATA